MNLGWRKICQLSSARYLRLRTVEHGRLTFNCGVILVDEVALDQLDRQAGLADAASSYDDKLVFSQKLPLEARGVWSVIIFFVAGVLRVARVKSRNNMHEGEVVV